MTREDRIKQGILSLDTGDYQALVSDYLTRDLGYARVIALGMKPGTHKTRAGTPDTFYHTGSHCVLMEAGTYTRKSDAEKKIREDAKKCTDYRDDHPELIVDSIVIAYTCTSVDPPDVVGIERDYEGVMLLGLDSLALGLLRYPWLVEEHLQIPMPSDQVLDVDAFVSKMDQDPFSPRMSNRMVGREEEKRRICQCIGECRSVLVAGQSGLGKTRLALEAVVSFLKGATNTQVWCVRSLRRDLYRDMQIALEGRASALVLVDDINEVVGLRPLLELCKERGATVVATVRASILDEVRGEMRVLGDVEEMSLTVPSWDVQHAILRDSFGIESVDARVAILSKSRGNLRFAQLVSEALEEGALDLANDPHELVEEVYEPLLSRVDDSQVKALEVLSILGATRLEDGVLVWLLGEWGLDPRGFVAACHELSPKELVSLTSRESAASIVEQNLRDFLIYRTLFERRQIGISELLEHGVGPKRLSKYVEVLCGVYRSEESVEYMSDCVRGIWDKEPTSRAFLCERMGLLLESRREAYVAERIEGIARMTGEGDGGGHRAGAVLHVLNCLRGMRDDPSMGEEFYELFLALVDALVPDVTQLEEFVSSELSFSSGAVASGANAKVLMIKSLMERYERSGNRGYAELLMRYAESLLVDVVTRVHPSIDGVMYSNGVLVMGADVMRVREEAVGKLRELARRPEFRADVADAFGSYKVLWDEVPDAALELQTHTAGLIADAWQSLIPLKSWGECVLLCDFLDRWRTRLGDARVARLLPKGSSQWVVRSIRGDGLFTSGAKDDRKARIEELAQLCDADVLLLPFGKFGEAWLCEDHALRTGYGIMLAALERRSHDDAMRMLRAYVRAGFGPSGVVRPAFEVVSRGATPAKARASMRLLAAGSRGGAEVAARWVQEFDYECIIRGSMDGIAEDIARNVLQTGYFLSYEEVLAVGREASGFVDEYLRWACGEGGFGARRSEEFLYSVDNCLGGDACQSLSSDIGLRESLESLALNAMAGGMACPHRLLTAMCEADSGFIDDMVDEALRGGGRGVEGSLYIVWGVGHGCEMATHSIERICANAEKPLLLHGAHRALVAVLSSMPEDDALREEVVPWLSERAMRAGKLDALICDAVSASLSEEERIRFVVGMVGRGLSPTELEMSCILYEPDVCFTGSEVARVDDDARFLGRLMSSMHGIRFARHRQAVEKRLEGLGKLRDSVEAREMTAVAS